MYTVVVVLILIISILLGLIVLVQNSKGGGLVSNLGSANQMMGVRKTADFLEKTTWTLAGILVVLCIVSSIMLSTTPATVAGDGNASQMEQQIKENMPAAPVPAAEMPTETAADIQE